MRGVVEFLQTTKLFVDTSSLMHPYAKTVFLGEIKTALKASKQKLIVPIGVVSELEKLKNANGNLSNQTERQKLAEKGYEILLNLHQSGVVEIRGGKDDQKVDGLFQQVFMQYRTCYPLTLITQDISLMVDILNTQNSNSVQKIKQITILEISDDGIKQITLEEAGKRLSKQTKQRKFEVVPTIKASADVKLAPRIEISTSSILQIRNSVLCRLGQQIGFGGEGAVYETSFLQEKSISGYVAKIYKPERLTKACYEKLNLMVAKKLYLHREAQGVCWPIELLFDQEGIFRGYLMQSAKGTDVGQCIFIRPELESHFPNWDRRHLVKLCITLLNKIKFLHENNILIGDINPNNIRIQSEQDIFLLDTDSYQLEGYPCPVGSDHFTPPELQGVDFSKQLRTSQHEAFAIATMLFMILHAGKPPYAQIGGGSPTENIRAMKFPYPFEDKSEHRAPEGPWKYIWSNLTYNLKKTFYEIFHKNYRWKQRLSVQKWIELLEQYLADLEKDYVSRELFPDSLKPVSQYAKQRFRAGIS